MTDIDLGSYGDERQRSAGRLHLITGSLFASHAPEAQPECPERLAWALRGVELAEREAKLRLAPGGCGMPDSREVISRSTVDIPLSEEALTAAHSRRYLEFLQAYAARGGGFLSVDTEITAGSYRAAATAANAVWQGVGASRDMRTPALVIARPPGHHAGAGSGGGFCLINHVAVAAKLASAQGMRVAVVDWDVHHGNGTAAILAGDAACLYVSIHEHPLYPFTGWLSDPASGPLYGLTVNVPLPGGLRDAGALRAMERIALPCLNQHRPDLILVSAGQDGHWSDPLSTWQLTARAYHAMAQMVRGTASDLGAGLVVMLEGGYSRKGLTLSMAGIAAGLLGVAPPATVGEDGAAPPQEVSIPDKTSAQLDAAVSHYSTYWHLV